MTRESSPNYMTFCAVPIIHKTVLIQDHKINFFPPKLLPQYIFVYLDYWEYMVEIRQNKNHSEFMVN